MRKQRAHQGGLTELNPALRIGAAYFAMTARTAFASGVMGWPAGCG